MPRLWPDGSVRRNHALEHATMAILQERDPRVRLIARSSGWGFRVYGTTDQGAVQSAAEEAMQRLRSGERSLAIAQRCGTNVAVGVLLGTVGLWLSEFVRSPGRKLALGLAVSVTIAVTSQPVGLLAQRYLTTESRLGELRIESVHQRRVGRKQLLEVHTAQ
ncbi:MAG TPA: DUF6391 domain-containing protein [Chloroflexota bacterium]|nr:DUF6391 domain-containing protein [Chloroflexota bacterium]